MSSKTGKRPLRSLSIREKLDAIEKVHAGESKAAVARKIGVPESTLRGWCKNEEKLLNALQHSNPDAIDSTEPKDKKSRLEDPVQPFNLSLKSKRYSPTSSESPYTPLDFSKNDIDATPKTPQSLGIKSETLKPATASQMTERERNRAELARLSQEYGLNRPEMYSTNNLDMASMAVIQQWQNYLIKHQMTQNGQQSKKISSALDSIANLLALTKLQNSTKVAKDNLYNDFLKPWANSNYFMSNLNGVSATPTTSANIPSTSSSSSLSAYQTNLECYKQLYNLQNMNALISSQQKLCNATSDQQKPILYKELTKNNKDNENVAVNDQKSPSAQSSKCGSDAENAAANGQKSPPRTNGNNVDGEFLAMHLQKSPEQSNENNAVLEAEQKLLSQLNISKNEENTSSNDEGLPEQSVKNTVDAENAVTDYRPRPRSHKFRSVLDSLLVVSNNNNDTTKLEDEGILRDEAIMHGEKFMQWLETCSIPSITAVMINQFRILLNNAKSAEKNSNVQQNKTKVRRK